ncbi:ABC transporter ATP-binding protein [Egibacter rhizosphaerae]|uniref:ABC transporter ATP-binding protein n=1 Tax=Egibacter rhizosphaerae TaxID=1670831 RepID=A0A411YKK4_9ACTN|nr:ABC transporter ATP-binding protein [Egibacter rhizosphaerae]QBI21748.1 ABC transporter ATP-binding protein [Egibacter rhizosphaerae]
MSLTPPTPRASHDRGPARPGEPVLEVEDLHVEFRTPRAVLHAVNGVSWSVGAGETLAILGESGSGKSVSAQAIMGIIDSPPGFVTQGSVRFRGQDLFAMSEEERRRRRGDGVAMIFQDALTALNPVFTVGWQIAETFRVHRGTSKRDAFARAAELLERVGIPSPHERLRSFPHEFSGGMRQRAMIAMSLALEPDVLIADEPTTALDVTVQAQIMDLLEDLQADLGMGMVLITHDLAVVADTADHVAVMYAGRIVEQGPVDAVFKNPAHPYTLGLMRSIPPLERRESELDPIPGTPPSPAAIPPGCPFHPRCAFARDLCRSEEPPLEPVADHRASACHFTEEVLAEEVLRDS